MPARPPLPRPVLLFVSATTVLPVILILIALYVSYLTKEKEESAEPAKVERGR